MRTDEESMKTKTDEESMTTSECFCSFGALLVTFLLLVVGFSVLGFAISDGTKREPCANLQSYSPSRKVISNPECARHTLRRTPRG